VLHVTNLSTDTISHSVIFSSVLLNSKYICYYSVRIQTQMLYILRFFVATVNFFLNSFSVAHICFHSHPSKLIIYNHPHMSYLIYISCVPCMEVREALLPQLRNEKERIHT
jgi:hypothetical protein